jgi:hypothetical protein
LKKKGEEEIKDAVGTNYLLNIAINVIEKLNSNAKLLFCNKL